MVFSLNQRIIVLVCWIGFCLAQPYFSNHNYCLDGPDFWCLNDTTENICNFTNKTIGICEYSSKRCPIITGQ